MGVGFWTLQFLNALQYAMLLFLLSVGLTVVLGLLHFVNLAHGAFYMMGAYLGVSIAAATGSYWAAFFLAPLGVMGIGAALHVTLIDRLRHAGPMHQVLATFGLAFVFLDLVRLIWGDVALSLEVPPSLSGVTRILGVAYPSYRLFIIALGAVAAAALWIVLVGTRIGAMIRAGVENGDMAAALGVDVGKTFFFVFCLGCALAGLAGVVAAPVLSAYPGMGFSILIPTLIVAVIGGLGSLQGAVAGSLIVGFIETLGAVLAPEAVAVLPYLLLAAVLVLRPQGLIPARR